MESKMGNMRHQTFINGCPLSVVYVPFFVVSFLFNINIIKCEADQDIIKK